MKYDPAIYISDPKLIRFYQSNWYWVDHFDKFWFVNDWQILPDSSKPNRPEKTFITESKKIIDCRSLRCLLITTPNNAPSGWRKIDEVRFLDGKTAFEIYLNK